MYDHLVAMVPCLESFGSIPEPPSKEGFLETYPNCINWIIYHQFWEPFAHVYVGPGGLDRDLYDQI